MIKACRDLSVGIQRSKYIFILLYLLSFWIPMGLGWRREWYVPYLIVPLIPFVALGLYWFTTEHRLGRPQTYLLLAFVLIYSSQVHPLLFIEVDQTLPFVRPISYREILNGFSIPKIIRWSSIFGSSDYDIEHTFKLLENAIR